MEQEIQMDLTKIFKEYIGRDEDGVPKAIVHISLLDISPDSNVTEKDSFHMVDLVIQHILIQEYFLSFALDLSKCKVLYQQKFESLIQEYLSFQKNNRHLYISVAGITEVRYQLILADPLICMRGLSIDSSGKDTVQMIFPIQAMNILENEIDYGLIRAEVEREYEAEEEAFQGERIENEAKPYPFEWKGNMDDADDSPYIRFTKEEPL